MVSKLRYCGFTHTNDRYFFTVYHSDFYIFELATQKASTEPARGSATNNNYSFDFFIHDLSTI